MHRPVSPTSGRHARIPHLGVSDARSFRGEDVRRVDKAPWLAALGVFCLCALEAQLESVDDDPRADRGGVHAAYVVDDAGEERVELCHSAALHDVSGRR